MCSKAKRYDSLTEQTFMLCYVISSYNYVMLFQL